jgi:prepilin-type N-terminal cleavage/methylation domain-containing protein
MNATPARPLRNSGFTLVELVGVLAIIAVLSAMLVPQVLGIISRSRVLDTVGSYGSIKAGAITYAAKHGLIGDATGAALDVGTSPPEALNWDGEVLFKLRLIDGVFRSRISTSASVRVRVTEPAATAPDGSNAAYNLLGAAAPANQVTGAKHVVEVRLVDVQIDDARELNRHLDGTSAELGESATGTDLRGRVKYDFSANATPGLGDVYLYVTHL